MKFFEKLIEHYTDIEFPENYQNIIKIGRPITWYAADSSEQFVSAQKRNNHYIIDIDISGAFPTICQNLFDNKSDFIKQLNQKTDKKERNIFIATTLKNESDDHLKRLNLICKLIILGTVFTIDPNLVILEFKKDGVLIDTQDYSKFFRFINLELESLTPFQNFIEESGFKFHITEYRNYFRCNKTTFLLNSEGQLIVKGIYKYIPKKIEEIIKEILLGGNIQFHQIQKVYSTTYFKICQHNNLDEILLDYYICSNGKFINEFGKYTSKLSDNIDPKRYLQSFIFPAILSTKI